jgi:hypothetical protein
MRKEKRLVELRGVSGILNLISIFFRGLKVIVGLIVIVAMAAGFIWLVKYSSISDGDDNDY